MRKIKRVIGTTDGHGWTRMVLFGLVAVQAMTACAQFTPPTGGRRTVMTTDEEYTNTVVLAAGSVQTNNATYTAAVALAESAVQPGDLDTAAYSNATAFASAAQGVLAESAVQDSASESYAIYITNEVVQIKSSEALTLRADSDYGSGTLAILASDGVTINGDTETYHAVDQLVVGADGVWIDNPRTTSSAFTNDSLISRDYADERFAPASITNELGSAAFAETNDFVSSSVDNLTAWDSTEGGVVVSNVPGVVDGSIARWEYPTAFGSALGVWHFDGDLLNSVDPLSGPALYRISSSGEGKFGQCAELNRDSDGDTFGSKVFPQSNFTPIDQNTDFSVEYWMKVNGNYTREVALKSDGVGKVFTLDTNAKLYIWQHFSFNYNGQTHSVSKYINGKLVQSVPYTGSGFTWNYGDAGSYILFNCISYIDDLVIKIGPDSLRTSEFTPHTVAYGSVVPPPRLQASTLVESTLVEAVDLATTALQTNDLGSAAFAAVEDFAAATLTSNVSALEAGTNTWNSAVQPTTDGNLDLTATSNITLFAQDEIILVPTTGMSVYAGAGDGPTMSITPDEVVIGPALVTGLIESPTTITVSAEESIELNSDALDASIWGNIKLEASDLSGPSSKLKIAPNNVILESFEGYKEARVIATNGTVAVEWKGGIADSLHRYEFGAGITTNLNGLVIVNGSITGTY